MFSDHDFYPKKDNIIFYFLILIKTLENQNTTKTKKGILIKTGLLTCNPFSALFIISCKKEEIINYDSVDKHSINIIVPWEIIYLNHSECKFLMDVIIKTNPKTKNRLNIKIL